MHEKNRYIHGLCLCEGLRACSEVYRHNKDLIRFAIASYSFDNFIFTGIELHTVSDDKFKGISATVNSQGIIFVVKIPEYELNEKIKNDYYVLLDRIADPGNFGTIIRTSASVGLKELWYSKGSVDPFSEKTIRAALAAQFRIKLVEYDNLSYAMKKLGDIGIKRFYRTEPSEGQSCFDTEDLFTDSAIIFGNEAEGLENIEGTIPLNIPMPGKFESLNLAQAVTVILFESVRRSSH